MSWFTFALLGYFLLAIVGILDKFILEKRVKEPAVFVFYSTIFVLPVFLLLPFGVQFLRGVDWLWALTGGVFFALALYAMYAGFKESEVSHAGPLVGAATPFFVVILGLLFLGENLTARQFIATGLLILGSLVISFEKSRAHDGWHRGMLWGVLAGLLFAVSHVASKYVYDRYGFYSGFVWTRGFLGACALPLLAVYGVRANLFAVRVRGRLKKQTAVVALDKILGVAGVVLVQYAIAIGSVSLVNALNGVQYGLLVLMIMFLSRFWPRFFRELYAKREAAQELLAVAIIAAGLFLLI